MKQELFRTIEQTKVIYSGQSIAPVSPGIEDNGEYQFCAAACLAYVGIKNKYGTHQSFEFVENLTAFNSKDTILTAFSKLGWSEEMCSKVMMINDSFDSKERKEKVLSFFDTL